MEQEERAKEADSSRMTYTSGQCINAKKDVEYFFCMQTRKIDKEPLTWTPPVCQVNFGEEDRLQSYIRPVDGVSSPGLYGIRRRGPI